MFLIPLLLTVAPLDPANAVPAPSTFDPAPLALQEPKDERMRLSFLLGMRSLDEDYWEPLDEPIALEAIFEWRMRESPFSIEFGMALGYDETTIMGVDIDNSTLELYAGLRASAYLLDGSLRPYLAAGPSLLFTDLTAEQGGISVSDDDTSIGLYARAGITYVFGNGFGLGLDYRKLMGTDISLFDAEGDSDFDQFGITFGFSF